MVPADVDSPEFCLGLQTLLSLKVRHPCLALTQNARRGRRLRVEAQIRLTRKMERHETCLIIPKRKMRKMGSLPEGAGAWEQREAEGREQV